MLILDVSDGRSVYLWTADGEVEIRPIVKGNRVRFGISAPESVRVLRAVVRDEAAVHRAEAGWGYRVGDRVRPLPGPAGYLGTVRAVTDGGRVAVAWDADGDQSRPTWIPFTEIAIVKRCTDAATDDA